MIGTSRRIVSPVLFCVAALGYPAMGWADFGLHMYLGDFNRSGAGKSTVADNATTAFNNPAGMSALQGEQLSVEAQYFMLSARYTDTGSTDAIGAPLTGSRSLEMEQETFVPGLYLTHRIDAHWGFGMTINAPFGLSTEWGSTEWVGRYQSVKTGIETLNINPSVSYRIDSNWSAGAGLSHQHAQAELSNAIDLGAVCLSLYSPALCTSIGVPAPQSVDGLLKLEGDDWGFGYNLGLRYSDGTTHIGLTYRSEIDYTLEGDADFTVPSPQDTAFAPAFTDTTGRLDLTLPEVISLGVAHAVNPDWTVMGDVTWTRWSRLERYLIQFDNPAQSDINIPRHWEDTWRIALGSDYCLNSKWMLQGGIAYAESAIPDDYFDPTIPISDAYWINLGFRYFASADFNVDFGWAHIIFEEREINYTGTYGETVRGSVDPQLDVLGITLNWNL